MFLGDPGSSFHEPGAGFTLRPLTRRHVSGRRQDTRGTGLRARDEPAHSEPPTSASASYRSSHMETHIFHQFQTFGRNLAWEAWFQLQGAWFEREGRGLNYTAWFERQWAWFQLQGAWSHE
ncbi:hypothetical protein EYF80_055437 [Liparis tanakae]|uniref:Uncharacterized protein n=1 Tax=Liparis tanakae TaxID=230148 RepID=A0A4Z2EZW2_9TELE|nr:hypothetical protein EYF80_055437 [Liparis tanakae]